MSILFRPASGPTLLNGVRLNQSVLGYPVAVVMGCGRIQQSLLWLDGFSAKSISGQTNGGSKGLGGAKGSEYDYRADVIAALCAGPILAVGDVWTGQSWLRNTTMLESYAISGASPSYTPANAGQFAGDAGVYAVRTVSGTYSDLASSTPTVINGTTNVPFTAQPYGTTLSSGQYSVNPADNSYHFSAADDGVSVTVTYRYALSHVTKQENVVIPSGLEISVGSNQTGEQATPVSKDGGVVYYSSGSDSANNGKALVRVSGTPTQTGTYSMSGSTPAIYKFAPGDVNQEVQITYEENVSKTLVSGTPQSLDFLMLNGVKKQAPPALMLSNYPGAALGYSGIAIVCFFPMDLGPGGNIQQNTYEVLTPDCWGGGIVDCNPVQNILQVLTNEMWGLGDGPIPFPASAIDNTSPGSFTDYRDAVTALSPVAHWRFDETAGLVVNDIIGGHNGAYTPSAAGVTFAQPGALASDPDTCATLAAATYASVPNSAALQLSAFTFAMWVKMDPTNEVSFIKLADFFGTVGWMIQRTGTASTCHLRVGTSAAGDQEVSSTVPIFDGNWHFIAVGVNGSTSYMSVDGEAWKTGALSIGNGIVNTTAPLNIFDPYRGGSEGSVDEVSLFGALLDIGEVQTLYNIGKTGPKAAAGGYGTWGTPTPTGVAQSDSSASSWFAANSFFISPVLDKQDTAASLIGRWLEAGMCAAFMSEGLMKLVPYGDTTTVGNGATWVAPSSFDAELDDTCFIVKGTNKDPVKISSSAWTEAYNTVQVSWNNRANQYAPEVTPQSDQAAINRYGKRIEDPQNYDFITTLPAAVFAASIRVKRSVYTRNQYTFTLPFRFGHLEPMSIVSITTNNAWSQDANNTIQLKRTPARITKIADNPDGSYDVTAEDLISGAHTPDGFSKNTSTPAPSPDIYADPGDTVPVMFDAPLALKRYQGNELWIGAAGSNYDWGGCNILASLDGDTYKTIGVIKGPSRLGTLNAAFPANADPDTTDSLVVNLQTGSAALDSGTDVDADNATTLCYVDGELISYSACALSGPDQYTMSGYIRRGLLGTSAGAHAQGSYFLRLDNAILKYQYDSSWIGKAIYLKFQSFNTYENSAQDLSTLTAYTFTPAGTSYPPPPVVTLSVSATAPGSSGATSSSGVVGNSGSGTLAAIAPLYVTVTWSWPANYPTPAGFNVVLFEGADPTNTGAYVAPVATVGDSARSYTFTVTPNSSMTNVNAAVESIYA